MLVLPAVAGTAFVLALAMVLSGCGSANYDPASSLGKQAILDAVALQLSQQNCSGAIAQLKPVYNSADTDNRVRLMMASAYGCSAHINLFQFIGDLATNSGSLATGGFWAFLATEFPSTIADRVPESAQLAQDALQSVLDPGGVILTNNMFNVKTFNPAAYNIQDRLNDANAYLFFVTMAAIGGIENRYGNPYPNGKKGNNLPWSTPASLDPTTNQGADGCAYASAIVNFADSLGALASTTSGTLQTTISSLKTTFQSGIYTACDQGCTILCGLSSCPKCPTALRDRTSCTGLATDASSCAAAGIATFVNTTPVVGWQTGP